MDVMDPGPTSNEANREKDVQKDYSPPHPDQKKGWVNRSSPRIGTILLVGFLVIGFVLAGAESFGVEHSLEYYGPLFLVFLGFAGSYYNTVDLNCGETRLLRTRIRLQKDAHPAWFILLSLGRYFFYGTLIVFGIYTLPM